MISLPENIVCGYCNCTEFNKKQNDGRVRLYKHSWILMFATLCLYLVYIITKTNI